MKPESWAIFHDGTIETIDGSIPGDLDLFISIEYLRLMFPGESEGFRISLTGCTKFAFTPYGEPTIESLSEIRKQQPEILYVDSLSPLVIDCATGKLELSYVEALVRLDSGEKVDDEQLANACKRYWDRFDKQNSH